MAIMPAITNAQLEKIGSYMAPTVHGMTVTLVHGAAFDYLVYTPNDSTARGVVLYLHGLGERGTDTNAIKRNEIPKLFNGTTYEQPYIFICPLLAKKYTSWPKNILVACFKILDTYTGKPRHVTGLSLGGMGTYGAIQYAYDYYGGPGYFTTACSVAGKTGSTDYKRFDGTYLKIYHGSEDSASKGGIGPSADTSFYTKLNVYLKSKHAGVNTYASIKIWAGYSHNVWAVSYTNTEYFKWVRTVAP